MGEGRRSDGDWAATDQASVVAEDLRGMTRQQTRIVVAALVVGALLLMIAITSDGDFGGSPRDGRGVGAATSTLYGAIIAGTFTLLGAGPSA